MDELTVQSDLTYPYPFRCMYFLQHKERTTWTFFVALCFVMALALSWFAQVGTFPMANAEGEGGPPEIWDITITGQEGDHCSWTGPGPYGPVEKIVKDDATVSITVSTPSTASNPFVSIIIYRGAAAVSSMLNVPVGIGVTDEPHTIYLPSWTHNNSGEDVYKVYAHVIDGSEIKDFDDEYPFNHSGFDSHTNSYSIDTVGFSLNGGHHNGPPVYDNGTAKFTYGASEHEDCDLSNAFAYVYVDSHEVGVTDVEEGSQIEEEVAITLDDEHAAVTNSDPPITYAPYNYKVEIEADGQVLASREATVNHVAFTSYAVSHGLKEGTGVHGQNGEDSATLNVYVSTPSNAVNPFVEVWGQVNDPGMAYIHLGDIPVAAGDYNTIYEYSFATSVGAPTSVVNHSTAGYKFKTYLYDGSAPDVLEAYHSAGLTHSVFSPQ